MNHANVYKVPGTVHGGNSAAFRGDLEALLRNGATPLVLDMSRTRNITSAGLRVIHTIAARLCNTQPLALRGMNSQVRNLLELAGFQHFTHMEDKQDEDLL